MEEKEVAGKQPAGQRESVTVPRGHNSLIVRLQGHTWVSISTRDGEIVREQSPDPAIAFSLAPGAYTVRTDGKIEHVTTEAFPSAPSLLEQAPQGSPAFLVLTSDAPDRHVVDGIGEIPADGSSFCKISVEKMDFDGMALTGAEHQDELFLRTTGGVLMDERGKQRIRSLTLRSGRAAFRLLSEQNPKVVTVSVLSREPHLATAEIQIEFV